MSRTSFPVDNTRFNMTGRFGPRKPIRLPGGGYSGSFHYGDDLAPEAKGTHEITYSPWDGKVHSVGRKADAGIFVIIQREDGYKYRACHLSVYSVRPGSDVYAGQPIGRVGNTGNSTGVHLHAEVYPPGTLSKRVDPKPFYWYGFNPATQKASAPAAPVATPAPAPAPAPTRPAPTPRVVIGSKIRLKGNWHAYRFADLRSKIGFLPAGVYEVRGIVNGHMHLRGKGKAGWVHRDAQAGLVK